MTDFFVEDFAVTPDQSTLEVLDGGRVRVRARLNRTGIQDYTSIPGKEGRVRLLRPTDEVFSKDALATLRSSPITIEHPPGDVTAANWRDLAVGHVEGHEVKTVVVDGAGDGKGEEFLETTIVLSDAEAIRRVRLPDGDPDKLREFSSGYAMAVDWTPGEYKGESYDGVQRSIRHNHQALLRVGDARAGREARILDSNREEDDMTFKEMQAALDAAQAEAAKAVEAQKVSDARVAALETQIGELVATKPAVATLDSAAVERAVSEAITLRDTARPMLPKDYDFSGKDSNTIKLDAIRSCRPEAAKAVEGNPNMVHGAFAALSASKTEYVAPIKLDDKGAPVVSTLSARDKHLAALAEANAKALAGDK